MGKFEVVNKTDGSRVAWTKPGEIMSSTLFSTVEEAEAFCLNKLLDMRTFEVRPARV